MQIFFSSTEKGAKKELIYVLYYFFYLKLKLKAEWIDPLLPHLSASRGVVASI